MIQNKQKDVCTSLIDNPLPDNRNIKYTKPKKSAKKSATDTNDDVKINNLTINEVDKTSNITASLPAASKK